jgi:TRAP-type C4-dicarboxylate transport system permease small subunit
MLRRLWTGVETLALAVLIALFVAMVIACTVQVIWRYIFDSPLVWSEELAKYLFIWVGFLSSWLAWKYRAHIALGAVTMLGGERLRRISNWIVEAIVLAFCLYTIPASLTIVSLTHLQPSAALQLPMSVVYAGYLAMIVLIALDILVGWFSPTPIATTNHSEA